VKYVVVPEDVVVAGHAYTFGDFTLPLLADNRWLAPRKHQKLADELEQKLVRDPLADSPSPLVKPGDVVPVQDLTHEILCAAINAPNLPNGMAYLPVRRRLGAFADAILDAGDTPPAGP